MRAVDYPFDIPTSSFVFHPRTGSAVPFEAADVDADGRVAVLAVGSNASPSQLRRKFPAELGLHDPIPVVRVAVAGLDAVYAARVARYGSIPATPFPAPGVTARLHVTLLTRDQLERMNRTEAVGSAYDLVSVPDGSVVSPAPVGDTVWCYRSRAGALAVDGRPVALRALTADGRRFPAWDQHTILEHVAVPMAVTVEEFVDRVVSVTGFREQVDDHLRGRGLHW